MSVESKFINNPKIVVIGGGTGISNIIRGLKKFTNDIVTVVTVADDGGGSGVLRNDLGILPPGDIRNCLIALANTEPIMEELLMYRFTEGNLKNQNFGNLLIAAMIGITSNFEEAIKKISKVLAITGRVLPVTLENLTLKAELLNGTIVEGESKIPKEVIKHKTGIKKISIVPKDAEPLKDCIEEILQAHAVVLGPGSLYTSILPNLKVNKICEAVNNSKGFKIYISNIMTQPGETDEYSLYDHVESIYNNTNIEKIDYIISNNGELSNNILEKYNHDNSKYVSCDEYKLLNKYHSIVIKENLVKIKNNFIRHDEDKLSKIIIDVINSKKIGDLQ